MCGALQLPRLIVETLQRLHLLVAPQLGLLHRRFQDANGLVVDLDRHGIGVAVLAAMRQREARRILEAVGRAVHDLGDHGERLHGAGADAGRQQQLRESRPGPRSAAAASVPCRRRVKTSLERTS